MNWLDDVLDKDSKVFHAGEIVFHSARETDSGGRTVVFKLVLTTAQQRMANPFSVATRRRGKKAGTRFHVSMAPVGPGTLPYTGEVMLLGWADGPAGSTATFLLGEDDEHPFMRCTKEDHWMAVFVEFDDQDKPVDQKAAAAAEHQPAKQKLSNQAAILLKSPVFCDWLMENYGGAEDGKADTALKRVCGKIQSKSELDTNLEAGKAFIFIRSEFNDR